MDEIREKAEKFARLPLEDTNLNPRMVRLLAKAGCQCLKDAFDEDEEKIHDLMGRFFSEFVNLVDSYFDKPERFVALMSREKPKREEKREKKPFVAVERPMHTANVQTAAKVSPSGFQSVYIPENVLSTPHGQVLKTGQHKAKTIFDDLCDRYDTVLVYQAFPAFSVELEEIRESFLKLFAGYASYPARALSISERYLPDLFLVFVADLARDSYADDNLWGNFLEVLPLHNNALNDLKKLFVELLEKRSMPLYCQDEAACYYLYTTLLHGGLSKDSWEDLWKSSLIPLARELKEGKVGFGGELSGHAILKELKSEGSRYAPKKESVMKILRKAPDSTLAPLFESALKVAMQTETRSLSRDEYVLLDSADLPEAAVVALHGAAESQDGERAPSSRKTGARQVKTRKRFINLPSADLCLDLRRGVALVRWTKKQYPAAFLGDRIDFFVDGKKVREQHFEMRFNKCILDDVEIEIDSRARYDIELRLMKRPDNEDGVFEHKNSLEQSFSRSKPGCFEFVQGIDGTYHLRGRNDRISRRRRVAYLLKSGYYIEPGVGMTRVSEYEASQSWGGASVFVFDIEPGASGSIYKVNDGADDEEVAVWQESYRAHINKHRIIGETLSGLDLYGYAPCERGDNAGLPLIVIEAADGLAAFRDLELSCTSDGRPFRVPSEVVWEDSYGDSRASQIALSLQRASKLDWHAEVVEIEARQISTGGQVVFRYRFAIIPIQEFRLDEAHLENGIVVAQYSFQSKLNVSVVDVNGFTTEVHAHERYSKRTLLKDEFLPLIIASEDGARRVNAKLALAAIDVTVPEDLAALSKVRPICLADAMTMGSGKSEILIKTLGWRYNRSIMLALHAKNAVTGIFLFKELKQPTEHAVNLFVHPVDFAPNDENIRSCSLVLSIGYGDEVLRGVLRMACTDVGILRCREGVGFGCLEIVSMGDGFVMRLDEPILCNATVRFRREGRQAKHLAETALSRGSTELAVPKEAVYAIRTNKEVVVTFIPKSRMGAARMEYSFDIPLKG